MCEIRTLSQCRNLNDRVAPSLKQDLNDVNLKQKEEKRGTFTL